MELPRWQSASRGGKAPRKKRRLSPLPGAVGPPGRAGASKPCRRRLFGTAVPRRPEPGCKRSSSRRRRSPGAAGVGQGREVRVATAGRRLGLGLGGAGVKAGGGGEGPVLCLVQFL